MSQENNTWEEGIDCLSCGADVSEFDDIPPVDGNESWELIAGSHAEDCEWVLTRGYQI